MPDLKYVVFWVGLVVFLFALLTAGSILGEIFWKAGMALMAINVVMIPLWPQRPDWTRPGFCVYCGYDLKGNTSGRCPECSKENIWREPAERAMR